MTTQIFFIRHGSHDRLDHILCGRMEGVGLGDSGRREAVSVARRLRHEAISALYVSPLQRAIETAAPLAKALGLAAETSERLNEIDMGDWTGTTFDQLKRRPDWTRRLKDGLEPAPGGESMLEVQFRAVQWLRDIMDRHPATGVAAVCHADVIKAALCHVLEVPLDNHRRIEISPGSVSIVLGDETGLRVRSVNDVPR